MSATVIVDVSEETRRLSQALGTALRESYDRGLTPPQIAGTAVAVLYGFAARDIGAEGLRRVVDLVLATQAPSGAVSR